MRHMSVENRPVDALDSQISELYSPLAGQRPLPEDTIRLARTWTDSDPRFIVEQWNLRHVTEKDILPLRRFNSSMGTILDVGAHYGYTAVSMRFAGTDCPIISLEAVAANRACLQALKTLDHNYDFFIGAASDRDHKVTLYTPVANGQPIGGINSIDGGTLTQSHVGVAARAIRAWLPGETSFDVKLGAHRVSASPLDDILESTTFRVDTGKIAAVKIDVEGHERQVLAGMRRLVALHKPLLIIEGTRQNPRILADLFSLGYLTALREDDFLIPNANPDTAPNYYFFHHSAASTYKNIGLLRDPS